MARRATRSNLAKPQTFLLENMCGSNSGLSCSLVFWMSLYKDYIEGETAPPTSQFVRFYYIFIYIYIHIYICTRICMAFDCLPGWSRAKLWQLPIMMCVMCRIGQFARLEHHKLTRCPHLDGNVRITQLPCKLSSSSTTNK